MADDTYAGYGGVRRDDAIYGQGAPYDAAKESRPGSPSSSSGHRRIHRIDQTVDVACPVRTCYDQWTQFEQFPSFMDGVEQVEQTDDTHLHWVANVAGKRREWDAEILEQVPDEVISWRSTSGALNNGSVQFEPHDTGCRIHLIMTYGVEDWTEKLADAIGILSAKVHGDLKRFKHFIEERQVQTGGWRGEVHGGRKRAAKSRTHRSGRLAEAGMGDEPPARKWP